jgi:hypothetical protein
MHDDNARKTSAIATGPNGQKATVEPASLPVILPNKTHVDSRKKGLGA